MSSAVGAESPGRSLWHHAISEKREIIHLKLCVIEYNGWNSIKMFTISNEIKSETVRIGCVIVLPQQVQRVSWPQPSLPRCLS